MKSYLLFRPQLKDVKTLMIMSTLCFILEKIILCVWDKPVFKIFVIIYQNIIEFISSSFGGYCNLDK